MPKNQNQNREDQPTLNQQGPARDRQENQPPQGQPANQEAQINPEGSQRESRGSEE